MTLLIDIALNLIKINSKSKIDKSWYELFLMNQHQIIKTISDVEYSAKSNTIYPPKESIFKVLNNKS